MNILAIDTSGKHLAVLIKKGGEISGIYRPDCGLTHSEIMLPSVDAALYAAGLTLGQIDCLSAVIGPGSFTGIRIGLTAVRAMCQVLNKPAVAVNSLEYAAYNIYSERIPVTDAGNGKVYYAAYDGQNSEILPPSACELPELGMKLRGVPGTVISALKLDLDRPVISEFDALACLSACIDGKLKEGEPQHYSKLVPLYVRVSQAEERLK